jgi:hypothetical protein
MKQSLVAPAVAAALLAGMGSTLNANVYAQTAQPADAASMVKPPVAPNAPNASDGRAYNPDNMPVKRPSTPPNSDRMLHNSPASDAIAK